MKELVELLNKASYAYYNTGNTIMSDAEFDAKLKQLQELEKETGTVLSNSPTINVGAVVLDKLEKIEHETPMLSLDKCHSVSEIKEFSKGKNLVASVKLDGLSMRLIYKDGELLRAESRGNGVVGCDITEHAKRFLNIPLTIKKKERYVINGEALIKKDDFEIINFNGEYKNPRNLAAGTLNSLDTSVIKERRMRFYAWEIVDGDDCKSFYGRLMNAMLLGFEVVPFRIVQNNEYQDAIDDMLVEADLGEFPQDGVVFKFDDIEYGKSLGATGHHFNNGIAYKIFNDSVETILKDIDWTMGKSGDLTPTAIFEPVEIDGTTVERANVHNITVMKDLLGTPWIGQKVGVFKANLIIPQIRWGEEDDCTTKNYLEIPSVCPVCGGKTAVRKDNDSEVLYCTNPLCSGKIVGKISHAVSRDALNINDISEATIQKFNELGYLTSLKDLFYLQDYKAKLERLDGFGKKSIEKILNNIEDARNSSFDKFLYSLSCPLLGKTASKLILKHISNKNKTNKNIFEFFMDLVHENYDWTRIDGIGSKIRDSVNSFCSQEWVSDLAKEFNFESKSFMNKPECSNIKLLDKTFVITGELFKFANRDKLKEKIESLGGKVTGSVSKKTNCLICNSTAMTGKYKKAIELGIETISEDDFIKDYLDGEM